MYLNISGQQKISLFDKRQAFDYTGHSQGYRNESWKIGGDHYALDDEKKKKRALNEENNIFSKSKKIWKIPEEMTIERGKLEEIKESMIQYGKNSTRKLSDKITDQENG